MMEFPTIQQESDDERMARLARFVGFDEMFPMGQLASENVQQRLLQAKQRVIELRVRAICDEYAQETGIEISDHARELLRLLHTAILGDAHPKWSGDLIAAADSYLSNLRGNLGKIAQEENVTNAITTFDILHWLSRDKDLIRLCVIEK